MAQRTTSKGGAGKAASKASVREAASNGPVGDGIDPRRKAALDSALEQVEKSFGKGSAMRLGDKPEQNVEVIPTGSLALDLALGIGGLPKGRIVEIYGPESSGKTTLALHVVANAQKNGGVAAFIDAEHALDPGLCPASGCRHRFPDRLAAGQRRAGAGDRGHAHPVGCP